MAENRPLQVLREAAMEDARVAAQALVEKGWQVGLSIDTAGPGRERVSIVVELPAVAVAVVAEPAKGFDWEGGSPDEGGE